MIKLLWRTDVHHADIGPLSRTDTWADTVLGKLEQVGKLAEGHDAVLDGGDFFHVKSPTRNSHALVQGVARVHAKYPCPVYGNIGNHDVKYGDWNFLPESPLGVLFETGVFQPCYGDEYERILSKDGVTVQIYGVPYHGTTYDYNRFRAIRKKADFLVVMGHQLASPDGGTMFEGEDIIAYRDLPDICPDADVFCFGHWHKNQGVKVLGENGPVVVNVGSLTRGSLSLDDLTRVPAVVSLAFEKGKPVTYNEIPLKVAPPEEIFDLTGRQRETQKASALEEFAAKFEEALKAPSKEPLDEVIRGMKDIDPDVRERALAFLEQA